MGTRYKKLLIFWTLHSLTCHCNSLFPQLREVVLSSHLGFQEPSLPCSLWEKAPGLARIYSVRCYLLHILFCSVSWSHFYSYLCSFSHSSQQFALCSSCCYPTLCVSLGQRSHSFAVLTVHFFEVAFTTTSLAPYDYSKQYLLTKPLYQRGSRRSHKSESIWMQT